MALAGLGVHAWPALAGGDLLIATPAVSSATASTPPVSAPALIPASSAKTPTPSATPTKAKTKAKAKAKAKPVTVPATGPGTYEGAKVSVDPATSSGTLKRFDVRVEDGLDIDAKEAALLIEGVLNDKRSWRGTGRWRFQLVSAGQPADLHAYIVTPSTTDKLCTPLLTHGDVSCQNGNRVVLNAKRWVTGVRYYGDDVKNYRRYLVNHEFGHALGFNHVQCPGSGELAPVMMQQTKGLGVAARTLGRCRRRTDVRALVTPGAVAPGAVTPLAVSLRAVPVREVRALLAGRGVPGVRWDPDYPTADSFDAMTMLLTAHEAMTGSRLTRRPQWWCHQIVVDQIVVGDIGFHGPPATERPYVVEIGYQVVPSARGRGVAGAACALLLRQAWRDGADLVRAETASINRASRRVLTRNGFAYRGDDTFTIERPVR